MILYNKWKFALLVAQLFLKNMEFYPITYPIFLCRNYEHENFDKEKKKQKEKSC